MNVGWITASSAALMAFWGQIQGIFLRIKSLVIVTAEVDPSGASVYLQYCLRKYTYSKIGVRRYTHTQNFIRPLERVGKVGYEAIAKGATIFKGIIPIFISGEFGGQSASKVNVTYFRGTYDFETDYAKAFREHNTQNVIVDGGVGRYRTKKLAGRSLKSGSDRYGDGQVMAKNEQPYRDDLLFRPIGYLESEIGSPTKENPFKALSYTPEIETALEEIRFWKQSQKWYSKRGLDWRRGMLCYGPPGNGKTSFVRAVGQELDIPVYSFDLLTMDNIEFLESWKRVLDDAPAIALMEDIDRIFDGDRNIKSEGLSMDCILNAIGGVEPSNGILLFVTANDVTRLDTALGIPDETGKSTRPGRLDRAVYFGPPNELARTKIAEKILDEFPERISELVKEGEGESAAQFQDRCQKIALKEYWSRR